MAAQDTINDTRYADFIRKTKETDITVSLSLDSFNGQSIDIDTGIGFLDHVSSNCSSLFPHTIEYSSPNDMRTAVQDVPCSRQARGLVSPAVLQGRSSYR